MEERCKMERFTDKEVVAMLEEDFCGHWDKYDEAYVRLAKLEDKFESGQLVELPCKVGDTVYAIPSKVNFELNKLHKNDQANRVYEQIVNEVRFNCNGWHIKTCDYAIQTQGSFKETWFTDKSQAEARLKELKEQKRGTE